MAATPNRKAEFAKFFDLFERLTNRALRKSRAQEQVTSVAAEASKPFAVPTDLALPAIRNLSSIASNNRTPPQQTVHKDWQESNGANSIAETTMVEDKKEETNKFPAGSWYPFTFKMMLHKLYELEEWAKKVKDVLEKSREDYRPLSEVDLEKKKKSMEEHQRWQTQSRLKGEVSGGEPAAMRTPRYPGSDDATPRKGTSMPKSLTKDNGQKAQVKHEDKDIKKRHEGRPTIVTDAQDCMVGNSQMYDSVLAVKVVEGILCRGSSSEEPSAVPSTVDGDSDRDNHSRLGYIIRSASASQPEENTSCTTALRKRAIGEADITDAEILPRKRPYLH